jgi:hypothetical protein
MLLTLCTKYLYDRVCNKYCFNSLLVTLNIFCILHVCAPGLMQSTFLQGGRLRGSTAAGPSIPAAPATRAAKAPIALRKDTSVAGAVPSKARAGGGHKGKAPASKVGSGARGGGVGGKGGRGGKGKQARGAGGVKGKGR